MNPHASTNCAGRLLMALAAITSISFMAACGNSPITQNNQVGFNNGSLVGTYVFSSSGSDGNGSPLALAGTFMANGKGGNGGITGGMMDVVDPAVAPMSPVAQTITSGSYQVGADGRGQATLTSAYGTFILDFVLITGSHGLVTEFDTNGTGSGTLDLQTTTPIISLAQLANPYAFSLAGADSGANPFAAAGAFTLNDSGAIIAGQGVEDFNDGGLPELDETLTGGITFLGAGTGGPGSIALNTPSHSLTYDFYPIDETHLVFIETDYAQFLSGEAIPQGVIPANTAMVFTMAGGTSGSGPIANGGVMTSVDGLGDFSGGLEDVNNDGVPVTQVPFSGEGGVAGVGGRVLVNLAGFFPATSWVIYPSGSGLLMLEADSANITSGAAYAQSATSFTAPGSYGFNLSGVNADGEVNDIAQFNATTTAAPAANMNGILDENVAGTVDSGPLTGTYAPGAPNSILATVPNSSIGRLTLAYYVVDSSNAIFIDLDSTANDTPQAGVGTFEGQTAPGGGGAVARPHIAVVHPAVRPHSVKGKWTPAASRK
jgi:hypothetical protein